MKKILLILLLSFIAKPDYNSFGFGVATSGDVDQVALGFEQATSKFVFTTTAGRAEIFDISFGTYGVSLDYAFGNFNEGSFYTGVSYARVAYGDEAVSDTYLNVGYGRFSGEGLDYNFDIDSEGVFSTGITQWTADGLGIGAGVAFTENDELVSLTLQYKW